MAGLTDTGITIETIETLLELIVADQLANIDAGLNTEADGLLGQLNALYAAALLTLWELLEEIWQAGFADTASGQSLTYMAAITGTIREVATNGTVTARFHGPDTTVVPEGTEFFVVGRPESRFVTLAEQTIGGAAYLDIACETTRPGSTQFALDGESIAMPNPPPDVTTPSAIAADSALGADEEGDDALRARREAELGRPGSATVEAIRADLLEVEGVDVAQVYENVTNVTDANGLPPKSIECLVYSESAPAYTVADIVAAIWAAKPAGTETFGSLSSTTLDSAGDSHEMFYSEPLEIRTYMQITLTYDGDYIGDTVVKTAVGEWALTRLTMGQDVIASEVIALVSGLAGVISVDGNATKVDDIASPANYDLTISLRQVATLDALTDITVTSTSI